MIFIVCYDLAKPNESPADYSELIDAIESDYRECVHLQESVWLIDAGRQAKASEIRDNLKQHLPPNASLFVVQSGKDGPHLD